MRADTRDGGYGAIGDYGLVGDAHAAALVASDGSVDWCCWPHFDSPAVFCRLLDAQRGGYFRVSPAGAHEVSREYLDGTNVLVTTFACEAGRVRLTDFMPIVVLNRTHEGEDIASKRQMLRLVEGLSGEVEMEVEFHPTFDFARGETTLSAGRRNLIARHETGSLALETTFDLAAESVPHGGLRARFSVSAGERLWLVLSFRGAGEELPANTGADEAEADLVGTLDYWREWSSTCTYAGRYRAAVLRSALVLKLLTFEETGALVAAPTTSLPEEIGGVRNWDYRFSWLRDSSLIIYALQLLGYFEEATDYFNWLERLCIPCRGTPAITYTIRGSTHLPEMTLDHLEGYAGSRPVRIGNAAVDQKQLDIYGAVLDAAHLFYESRGIPMRAEFWPTLELLANEAAANWREKDKGIWEVRSEPQHFLYSKLLCWVALDRAIKLAPRAPTLVDAGRWARTRDEIAAAILSEGYDEEVGAFTQAFGSRALDASALAIPIVGFLPATDPRVVSTIEAVLENLSHGGLTYRYKSHDGLPGGEGVFLLCSFWMVDNLAACGRVEEARELFERIVGYSNDLGLLSEEVEAETGQLLGNFPQGFTHLGLICSALNIERAERFGGQVRPETPSERAEEVDLALPATPGGDGGE